MALFDDWYEGRPCTSCGRPLPKRRWYRPRPGLVAPDGSLVTTDLLDDDRLRPLLETHRPICPECRYDRFDREIRRETGFSEDARVESELVALEHEWTEAWRRCDRETCDRLMTDDFLLTSALDGEIATKAQFLEGIQWVRCDTFHFDRIVVRLYGDAAVVKADYRQTGTARGEEFSGRFRITDVWVRQRDRWRMATRHASRVPAES